MKLTPLERGLALVTALLLVANGGFLGLGTVPAQQGLRSRDERLRVLQARIRALRLEERGADGMLASFREVEEYRRSLPPLSEMVPVLERLADLAARHALKVPSTEYRPAEDKEAGLTRLTVNLGLEGNYGQVRRFLYELEKRRRSLVIEALSLRDAPSRDRVHVQLQVAAYFQADR